MPDLTQLVSMLIICFVPVAVPHDNPVLPSGMKQATAEAVTDGPLYDMDGKSREATAAARWDLIFEEPK